MPSTICAKLYKNIQAKYFEYAGLKRRDEEKLKSKGDSIEKETWNRGNKRKRTEESHYFNNHDFVNIGKSKKYNFDDIECAQFEKTYSRYFLGDNTKALEDVNIEGRRIESDEFATFLVNKSTYTIDPNDASKLNSNIQSSNKKTYTNNKLAINFF